MNHYAGCQFCHKKLAEFVITLEKYSLDMDRCTRVYDSVLLCSDCAENNRFKIEKHDFGFDVIYEIRSEEED